MKIIKFLAAGVISLAAVTGNAATIWQPTDVVETGNVNIFTFSFAGLNLNSGTLALFEDTDSAMSNALVLGSSGGVFEFTGNGSGSFTVEAFVGETSQGTLGMTGNEFILGVNWGSGYVGDSSYIQDAADPTSFTINFSDVGNAGSVFAVDLQPVPLPATAWLFGAALLGFAGVSRRTKA